MGMIMAQALQHMEMMAAMRFIEPADFRRPKRRTTGKTYPFA